MGNFRDLTGQKFGRLTALERAENTTRTRWICICECGNKKTIFSSSLISGNTKSCGCFAKENIFFKRQQFPKGNVPFNKKQFGESSLNGLYRIYRHTSKKRQLEFTLNLEDFKKLTSSRCHYCNCGPRQKYINSGRTYGAHGYYIYNGIDRKDNSKGYILENCVSCCGDCNFMKGELSENEFLQKIIAIEQYKFHGISLYD